MTRLLDVRNNAITPALALLPAKMGANRVRVDVQLLTTHLQEAPNGEQCQVTRNRDVCGPARGIWQFEKGGGVRGVLTHPASKAAAVAACKALGIKPTEEGVFAALPGTVDVIDAVFARLLYWTDKDPLPTLGDVDTAWRYYLRNWRPGAYERGTTEQREALRHKWGVNYRRVIAEVVGVILPGWAIGAAGGVLVLGASHWFAYSTGVDHEATRQRLAIAGTSNAALVVARSIETAQAVATVERVERAQSDLSAIPDVRPDLDRLRDSNAELRGQLSRAAVDAERGQAATSAAMVLSDMLRRAEKRIADLEPVVRKAADLAEAYDRGRVAGNLCTELSDAWRTAQLNGK